MMDEDLLCGGFHTVRCLAELQGRTSAGRSATAESANGSAIAIGADALRYRVFPLEDVLAGEGYQTHGQHAQRNSYPENRGACSEDCGLIRNLVLQADPPISGGFWLPAINAGVHEPPVGFFQK